MQTEDPSLSRSADRQRELKGGTRTSVGKSGVITTKVCGSAQAQSPVTSIHFGQWKAGLIRCSVAKYAYDGRNFEEGQETYSLMLFAEA